MRGEEALRRAEELLDEAAADLQGWQRSEPGSVQEATLAEGVRLRVALAHELALMQYVDEPEPVAEAERLCAARVPTALSGDQDDDQCRDLIGHAGPHRGLKWTWGL